MSAFASDLRPSFRHEALLYNDQATFLEGNFPFIRDGLAAGEPVLLLRPRKTSDYCGPNLAQVADQVRFADMAEIGANPRG